MSPTPPFVCILLLFICPSLQAHAKFTKKMYTIRMFKTQETLSILDYSSARHQPILELYEPGNVYLETHDEFSKESCIIPLQMFISESSIVRFIQNCETEDIKNRMIVYLLAVHHNGTVLDRTQFMIVFMRTPSISTSKQHILIDTLPNYCTPSLTYLHDLQVTYNPFHLPLLSDEKIILDDVRNSGQLAFEFTCSRGDVPDQIRLLKSPNKVVEKSDFTSKSQSKTDQQEHNLEMNAHASGGFGSFKVTAGTSNSFGSLNSTAINSKENSVSNSLLIFVNEIKMKSPKNTQYYIQSAAWFKNVIQITHQVEAPTITAVSDILVDGYYILNGVNQYGEQQSNSFENEASVENKSSNNKRNGANLSGEMMGNGAGVGFTNSASNSNDFFDTSSKSSKSSSSQMCSQNDAAACFCVVPNPSEFFITVCKLVEDGYMSKKCDDTITYTVEKLWKWQRLIACPLYKSAKSWKGLTPLVLDALKIHCQNPFSSIDLRNVKEKLIALTNSYKIDRQLPTSDMKFIKHAELIIKEFQKNHMDVFTFITSQNNSIYDKLLTLVELAELWTRCCWNVEEQK